MRFWKIGSALILATLIALAGFVWREIRRGFSTRSEPSSIEELVAATARNTLFTFLP